jgi:phosphopantetheinyl transferase (holo-ACP synthase)
MIGNDIVDLKLARQESNWQRKGFLDKIFTKNEQKIILDSSNPDIAVWSLWSRKEAAYKIYNRQTNIRKYNPIQFECFDTEIADQMIYGKVVLGDQTYYTKTKITKDLIDTIAVLNISDFVKTCTINHDIIIHKVNDIPFYYNSSKQMLDAVSISHHGRFKKTVCLK